MAVGPTRDRSNACRDTCQLPAAEIAAARTGGRRAARGVVALAVVTPGGDPSEGREIERALAAKVDGIVLGRRVSRGNRGRHLAKNSGTAVIELTSRSHLRLGSAAPVIGTYQVSGRGSPWTRAGQEIRPHLFGLDRHQHRLPARRARLGLSDGVDRQPAPPKTAVAATRYLQAIADAGISGARWVVALDDDLAGRLAAREEAAMGTWKRIAGMLAYFEQHPEWRALPEGGQLALVQDPEKGGLVSGGILDMIAVKHTPVRPIPRQRLSAEALAGATMAVNVDGAALTPSRRKLCAPSRGAVARYSPDRRGGRIPRRQRAASRSRRPNWNASTISGTTSTR